MREYPDSLHAAIANFNLAKYHFQRELGKQLKKDIDMITKLLCFFGIHDYTEVTRISKPRKSGRKTVYDVFEVTRCSRCGKAKLQYMNCDGVKRYEKCLGVGYTQAKAMEIIKCKEKK